MTIHIAAHKNMLINILKDIYTDPHIGPYLGFKGGTAVLLFYDLTRFSVDLDFDLLDASKEDYIFKAVKSLLEKYGTVSKEYNKRFNIFYCLSYHDKKDGSENIKVEINKRSFGSHYEIKHYLGIAMQVMVKEDIAAHKLVAMHERMGHANRDIFDVWFFLSQNWPINKVIIEKRTGMKYKEFLQLCIQELEALENPSILSGMGELLDAKQKAWVKNTLLAEVLFQLRLALSHEI